MLNNNVATMSNLTRRCNMQQRVTNRLCSATKDLVVKVLWAKACSSWPEDQPCNIKQSFTDCWSSECRIKLVRTSAPLMCLLGTPGTHPTVGSFQEARSSSRRRRSPLPQRIGSAHWRDSRPDNPSGFWYSQGLCNNKNQDNLDYMTVL